MFKLSKHIFIVFLISTIVPLVLILFLHHYKISNDMKSVEDSFLNAGIEQFENSLQRHLDMEKDFTFNTIANLPYNNINLKQYKNIFRADNVYFVSSDNKILNAGDNFKDINLKEFNEPIAYYDLLKETESLRQDLVTVIYVPFKNNTYKGLVLIKKVPFHRLHPKGPFDIEFYSGQEISPSFLLNKIEDDFAKPELHHPRRFHGHRPPAKMYKKPLRVTTVNIENFSGETIATVLLRLHRPHMPFDKFIKIIGFMIIMMAAILSISIGIYIKKNFINPFVLISNASKKVQDGDFSSDIEYKSKHSETRETIDRFNDMVEGLREKEELRNSFITSLTHDLRTPLIAQDRAIEYIIKEFENLSLEEPLALAKGLEQNNKHLLRMVNSLVESYHFDSGEINIKVDDINLFELVDNCSKTLLPLANEKNIEIVNSVYKNLSPINADEPTLQRVLLNLIANAIDNFSKEGKVEISVKIKEPFIKIIVEDNGNGIAKEDMKHLFDKYYTGKTNERKIGSGLGLYICKKLVEFNKGSIEVESELGKFTRFIITLPKL